MADYYGIETSNQAVTGTAAGGNDTIKVSNSAGAAIQATIINLAPSSVIELGGGGYYTTEADGIKITNPTGNINLKLLGTTDTSIFNNSAETFISLDKYTSANGQGLYGTNMNDNLVVNHSNCTANGYSGDDLIVSRGNNNYLYGDTGDDTITAAGDNNTLTGYTGHDVFIVGGSNNSVSGDYDGNTFEIYSYTASGSNNTLTGGSGYNTYMISTGLVGVDGTQIATAAYNPNFSDTVNVTITDAVSGDSYYIRDWGNFGINMQTTSDGVVISSTSGRIKITMAGQRDWNAVKSNQITLDNAQGFVGTYTLEQAVGLTGFGSLNTAPAGIFTAGDYLLVSSSFVGNLVMSSAAANYTNNQIITIDATQNYQVGMQLSGNSNSNAIFAGQGGNILWGGDDTVTDYLFGGAGADVFIIGKNDGNDAVYNSDYSDAIYLNDVTVDDIISYTCDANTIALGLSSGNVISVVNGDAISPMFVLSNGQGYRFNRSDYSWQSA